MTDQVRVTDTELESTFDSFFGETEETAGTGAVICTVKGELTEVVVDRAERDAFRAQTRAKADARNAEVEALHRAEAEYYAEKSVG